MDGNGAQGMNPHDLMRVNMVKGRMGAKKNVKMGHMGHASGMHHKHHGPPGMGAPGGGMGAGSPAPGAGAMGGGPTMPTMGGF